MLRTAIASCISVFLIACNQAPAEPAPAPAPEPAPAAEPAKAAAAEPAKPAEPEKLSDRAEDPSFELALVPSGDYESGKLASFAVSLTPRGEYHVNQDYPMSIELSGPDAIAFAKPRLDKPDAAEFTEKKARFDVPFTPASAGEHQVTAKVKFAVCTPETCVPDERTLALAVAVK
jgi:hypothetical protein